MLLFSPAVWDEFLLAVATVGIFSPEVSASQAPLRSFRVEHGFWRPLGYPEGDETQKEDVRPLARPHKAS